MDKQPTLTITRDIAAKVLETVDAGLSSGLGEPVPGKMCIQAAIAYALGRKHGDNELQDCVGSAVRALDIILNDAQWSSPEARAKGMRREAIAKLGSAGIDQVAFAQYVALETVKRIVPIALRAAAVLNPKHKYALEAAADVCQAVTDLVSATAASDAASDAASAASYAASAASYAASDAASAASYAASDAASAASYAASAASDAASAASYAARAASYAVSYAVSYAARDAVLTKLAEIAVEALVNLGSLGAQWLDICQ